jgi:CHASE2 domain-containing sensor protein
MPSFTTAVIKMFDPVKGAALSKRKQQKTEIRYFGDQQNFNYLEFEEVMSPTFNIDSLKDKIVLLGYMGLPNNSPNRLDEDRLFTPLNKQLSGRSLPDMYGTVVIANILRMELDNDYIYAFPVWLNWLLAFIFSWILLPLFVRWYVHKAVWFHLFTIVLQLCISMGFVFLSLGLYANLNVKIESSAVLVSVLLIGDFLLLYDHLVKFFRYKLRWNFNSVFLGHEH